MAYDNLIVIDRGPARIIQLNRPEALNALNKKTLTELDSALIEAELNVNVRCLILTGAGEKAFVAGADLAEMKSLSPAEAEEFSRMGHEIMDRMERTRMPVIAAVNGFALGGGLELALACDFIYASDNARLGLPETGLGLIPGFGGLARLARRVGVGMAREMVFSAKHIKAEEAHRVGLVNKVVAVGEVVDAAVKAGETIAKNGPYAVALCKRVLLDGQDADHRTANLIEQHSFGLVFGTKDHDEGIAAFLEKRNPSYEGR
jgi:enoyl-CoA hydratase